MVGKPLLSQAECMNHAWSADQASCTRCLEACPADAIHMSDNLPAIDSGQCTSCTACVTICPTGAISDEQPQPDALTRQARALVMQGKRTLRAACSHVSDATADLSVPCHAAWNPLLLACLAGEGVHLIELDGISQCAHCPLRHGERMMVQTERDYAELNKALGVRLVLSREITQQAVEPQEMQQPEPERRAFFRKLIPSLAQSAAMTVAHISDVMRQDESEHETDSHLPITLQMFNKSLPRLQPNFTPVPRLASIPLGAVQADDRCSACGECVEQCPTEALELRPFGTNHILEFRPDACIGCNHCVDICPEHAMTPLPSLSMPAIAARRSRPLVMVAAPKPKKDTIVS